MPLGGGQGVKNHEIWTFKVNFLCQQTSEPFWVFFSLKNISWGPHFLITAIFKSLYLLKFLATLCYVSVTDIIKKNILQRLIFCINGHCAKCGKHNWHNPNLVTQGATYKGLIIVNKVKSRNMFADIGAGFKSLVGGEIKVSKSRKQISKFSFEPKTNDFFLYFCPNL